MTLPLALTVIDPVPASCTLMPRTPDTSPLAVTEIAPEADASFCVASMPSPEVEVTLPAVTVMAPPEVMAEMPSSSVEMFPTALTVIEPVPEFLASTPLLPALMVLLAVTLIFPVAAGSRISTRTPSSAELTAPSAVIVTSAVVLRLRTLIASSPTVSADTAAVVMEISPPLTVLRTTMPSPPVAETESLRSTVMVPEPSARMVTAVPPRGDGISGRGRQDHVAGRVGVVLVEDDRAPGR